MLAICDAGIASTVLVNAKKAPLFTGAKSWYTVQNLRRPYINDEEELL